MAIFDKIQYYSVSKCSRTVWVFQENKQISADLHINVLAPKLNLHDPESESYALALPASNW